MILRLEVPNTNPSLRGGSVKEWHKSEGDTIGYGEEICTISFDDFAALRRTGRATLLAGRKRKNLKSQLESREGKVLLDVVLTSAESATLHEVLMQPGERFAIGDTLALVATESGDDSAGGDWSVSPPMRVVANSSADPEHV